MRILQILLGCEVLCHILFPLAIRPRMSIPCGMLPSIIRLMVLLLILPGAKRFESLCPGIVCLEAGDCFLRNHVGQVHLFLLRG